MAGERRSRSRRLVGLLLVALLVFLLLELNRFLPGSWPGGGGDAGMRRVDVGAKPDPARLVPSEGTPPETAPKAPRVRIVLRDPEGRAVAGTLAPLGAAEVSVPAEGVDWSVDPARGPLTFAREGARLMHGTAPPTMPGTWVVQWQPVPSGAEAPPAAAVRVTDEAGAPIAGAEVLVRSLAIERRGTTDAAGEARLLEGVVTYRACASAPGFGETCTYGSTRRPGAPLRLHPVKPYATTFVDPAGAALTAKSLRLVADDGSVRVLEKAEGGYARFDVSMPTDVAARTRLEIEVEGRPTASVPLAALQAETPLPAGKALPIVVKGADGAPRPHVRVEAKFAASAAAESGAPMLSVVVETDDAGKAMLPVPDDRPVDVVAAAPDAAPAGLRLSPGEAIEEKTVVLARGVAVPVVVRDPVGAPVARADVLLIARAGYAPVRRATVADDEGKATLPRVEPGRVEVLAHRAGTAWASTTAEVKEGMAPVELSLPAGKTLHLIVEDPDGVPVAGVSVRATPRTDVAAGVPDAADPDAKPWATNVDGLLVVPDLPDRELDLYLVKDGFADQVFRRVRPGSAVFFATLVPVR
jgi:hypothetical protein